MSDYDPNELVWIVARDIDGAPLGKIGLLRALARATPRHADGWAINWCAPVIEIEDKKAVAAFPFVLLSVPDYPADDAIAVAFAADDAIKVGRALISCAENAKREIAGHLRADDTERRHVSDAAEAEDAKRRAREATRCAEVGCRRERTFFDADGVGYCKRHADERGIRPRGKIA